MAKVKVSSIPKQERMELVGDLFDVVYGLKTKTDTIDFLIGLLTPSESLMLARRIQVAKQLLEGKTYDEIRKNMKVSYNTINGIEHWMNARDNAYRKVLANWVKRKNKRIKEKERVVDKYQQYAGLLDKYPQHRFLKKLLGL